MERWNAVKLFDHVDLMVMEDNPSPTFEAPVIPGTRHHFSWEDIAKDLGDDEWIIPRRSDTVRSYAYWQAWKEGYKYILTLDDDCYPCTKNADGMEYNGEAFVKDHLGHMLNRSRWFNTLNMVKPRGIPYYEVGKADKIVLNHGLWTNVLDYDAPWQLANPAPEKFSFDSQVVPQHSYFPMCGMNVMWKSEITVLMYHLLMGKRKFMLGQGLGDTVTGAHRNVNIESDDGKNSLLKLPFDRFGDIWCGIIMKKICDNFGFQVSTGMPYIRHERASNPFANLKKEANGIEVNEKLWSYVDSCDLSECPTFVSAYAKMGDHMSQWDAFPEYSEYFRLLGKAMKIWSELFK
jgi:reversibly glycosylated polypeptide/UDP-arabinopyranose mutase